ncbi:unnamed protein product [Pseudo-nitzschia multistriata]|uniref:Peptidase C1A papain C-terminal domain-containing protein n=1 Tax=Pseudo-nitzschia multistriata TaxID=183589 RepID=A0A448ZBX5_9STRA|nr:unnamed protein product [Pseudo-nitzschia multistriata]
MRVALHLLVLLAASRAPATAREILYEGDEDRSHIVSPLPHTYLDESLLPKRFDWGRVADASDGDADRDGDAPADAPLADPPRFPRTRSMLTRVLNQHVPQYCGSCWAHSSLSALADRIKIDRGGAGTEINLSVQFLLSCGASAGSCHGGSAIRAYAFLAGEKRGTAHPVPYDTCSPYLACSSDSEHGFCPHADTSCGASARCKTCANPSHEPGGGACDPIGSYPNATVAEYGSYSLDDGIVPIMAEILMRGPVKASVNAGPLLAYEGGILVDSPANRNTTHNHGVSIVGWGYDDFAELPYWIVRNSKIHRADSLALFLSLFVPSWFECVPWMFNTQWGEYWGELGFFRVELGKNLLGIEAHVCWATPGSYTETNLPCLKDGSNCRPGGGLPQGQRQARGWVSRRYEDPSNRPAYYVRRRLFQAGVGGTVGPAEHASDTAR